VDLAAVRDTKSYLAQLVSGQASNALRASARRREDYVGPWPPEPLLIETIAMPRPMWFSPSRSRWDRGGREAVQPSLPPDAKVGEWRRPSRRRPMLGPSKHLRA
jgi:hypothetical protein